MNCRRLRANRKISGAELKLCLVLILFLALSGWRRIARTAMNRAGVKGIQLVDVSGLFMENRSWARG